MAEPLTSHESDPELLSEVRQMRELFLYSAGLLIFCMAVVAMRARKG